MTPQTKVKFTLKLEGTGEVISQEKTLAELGFTQVDIDDHENGDDYLELSLNDLLDDWLYEQTTRDWDFIEGGELR